MKYENLLHKWARMACAGIVVSAAASLYAVPAEAATSNVPCSATALASAVGGAASGATLSLAPYCTYQLTAALPTVGQDLTILGNHATLERSYAQATPAFTILSVAAGTLAISNLNVINGAGAMAATGNASIVVTGGRFSGNHAANGGAINSTTGMGSLTVTGTVFSGNSATQSGGAIYTNEAAALTTVTDSTFIGNKADDIGGAIYNFFDMKVSRSTFTGNEAENGGAIFNNAITDDTLTNVTIEHNHATQDGGGVYTLNCGLTVLNSQISGNSAANNGGGIYQNFLLGYPYGLMMTGTSVRGNTARNGAGIYGDVTAMFISNSTVLNNAATGSGGGIYDNGLFIAFGELHLNGTQVSRNRAGAAGGGIYNTQGLLDATASLIVHNAAAHGGGIFNGPGPNTVSLATSPVLFNQPDNCAPPGTIPGCSDGSSGMRQPGPSTPVSQRSRHRGEGGRLAGHVPWSQWHWPLGPGAGPMAP